MNIDRRTFIKKTALTSGFAVLGGFNINLFGSKVIKKKDREKIELKENSIILFQGDSITDAYRLRTELETNSQRGLGVGYAFMIASELLESQPEKKLSFYNRGQGGNKIFDLERRWESDTLNLKPDILTIIIGINDYFYHQKEGGTVNDYIDVFRNVIKKTIEVLPDVKLIIGEPFILDLKFVKPDFKDYQMAAKKIATEFNATFIPYQEVFNKALEIAPKTYWGRDNIHPNIAGAKLMAEVWLDTLKLTFKTNT